MGGSGWYIPSKGSDFNQGNWGGGDLQVDSVADEIRRNFHYILFYWIHGHASRIQYAYHVGLRRPDGDGGRRVLGASAPARTGVVLLLHCTNGHPRLLPFHWTASNCANERHVYFVMFGTIFKAQTPFSREYNLPCSDIIQTNYFKPILQFLYWRTGLIYMWPYNFLSVMNVYMYMYFILRFFAQTTSLLSPGILFIFYFCFCLFLFYFEHQVRKGHLPNCKHFRNMVSDNSGNNSHRKTARTPEAMRIFLGRIHCTYRKPGEQSEIKSLAGPKDPRKYHPIPSPCRFVLS